jgi:hypothetical protein
MWNLFISPSLVKSTESYTFLTNSKISAFRIFNFRFHWHGLKLDRIMYFNTAVNMNLYSSTFRIFLPRVLVTNIKRLYLLFYYFFSLIVCSSKIIMVIYNQFSTLSRMLFLANPLKTAKYAWLKWKEIYIFHK